MTSIARPLVLTVWGSDFNWFGRRDSHRRRIRRVLSRTSQLVVECERDEVFARQHGYRGPDAIRVPASGAIESVASQRAASQRETVLVKGYSGFMGLGPATIDALVANADLLARAPVIVFSASLRTRACAARARRRTDLNIRCIPKHGLAHSEMLGLLRSSRVLIALSQSDGFPGVVREALSCGTFVIHSDTACLEEWVGDAKHVRLVDVSSTTSIRSGVRQGLRDAIDDGVVDRAATSLQERARATWSSEALLPVITGFYDRLTSSTEPAVA